MSLVAMREKKYVPVPSVSSGRKDVIGEPVVPSIAEQDWKDVKIEVSDGVNTETLYAAYTDKAHKTTQSSENVKHVADVGTWVENTHFLGVRHIVNFDDFDRPVVGTLQLKDEVVIEMTIFVEIFDSDKKRMASIARRKESPISDEGKLSYISVRKFYYDARAMSKEWLSKISGQVITKFLPRYFCSLEGAQVIGAKSYGPLIVELLTPLIPGTEMVEMMALTKFKACFPRIHFDSEMMRFQEEKLIIIDAEYVQKEIADPNGLATNMTRIISPIAAYTIVEGNEVKSYKCFVDPTDCEGLTGSKCKSALKFVGRKFMGDKVEPVMYPQNGGIPGFRLAVQKFANLGYKVVAKGSRMEAMILADIGCTQPLTPQQRRSLVNYFTEPGTTKHNGVPLWTEPRIRGPSGTHSQIRVWELGGETYDRTKRSYFDRYDWELLLSVYESGHWSLSHHPLSETFVFAHHYIANKYNQKYYIEKREVSMMRYAWDVSLREAKKIRQLTTSGGALYTSTSNTLSIVDSQEEAKMLSEICSEACVWGCIPSCPNRKN
jgi:hypothetical protein